MERRRLITGPRTASGKGNLIGATRTRSGLEVYARLDEDTYPNKIQVSDAEAVNLIGDALHPEWNYCIKPRRYF